MASDVGAGDSEVATLVITPAGGDTSATLTVHPPTGAPYDVAATGGTLEPVPDSSDQQQTWTANEPVLYDQAGRWVLHWGVTGTGEGAEDYEVYVVASPVAGGPTWWPGRSRVAAYVPHRTLVRSTSSVLNSQDSYELSFGQDTRPTGLMVDRLIADGAAWVSALITPLHTKSEPLASVLVALWAAISVERSWPDDDDSLQRANDMEKQLNTMLAALKTSNDEANNGTDDGFDIVYPVWAFPAADPRYDSNCYW
jgi:hypothetical protein